MSTQEQQVSEIQLLRHYLLENANGFLMMQTSLLRGIKIKSSIFEGDFKSHEEIPQNTSTYGCRPRKLSGQAIKKFEASTESGVPCVCIIFYLLTLNKLSVYRIESNSYICFDFRDVEVKRKNLSTKETQANLDTTITVDDLTNPEGPSEKYWQLLAEKRQ